MSDWLNSVSIADIRADLTTTNELGNGNWFYREEDGLLLVDVYSEADEVIRTLRVGISLSDWGTDA